MVCTGVTAFRGAIATVVIPDKINVILGLVPRIPCHNNPRSHTVVIPGVRGPRAIACDWVGWSGRESSLFSGFSYPLQHSLLYVRGLKDWIPGNLRFLG